MAEKPNFRGRGLLDRQFLINVPARFCTCNGRNFGPVLSILRVETLEDAIAVTHRSPYGNMAVMFTDSGYAANKFKDTAGAGMIGINVGVPAPMAVFPFCGWKDSFFGTLHSKWRRFRTFLHRRSHNCESVVLKGQLWHE